MLPLTRPALLFCLAGALAGQTPIFTSNRQPLLVTFNRTKTAGPAEPSWGSLVQTDALLDLDVADLDLNEGPGKIGERAGLFRSHFGLGPFLSPRIIRPTKSGQAFWSSAAKLRLTETGLLKRP